MLAIYNNRFLNQQQRCSQLHEGHLTVESEIGIGTKFIVTLPVKESLKAPAVSHSMTTHTRVNDKTLQDQIALAIENKNIPAAHLDSHWQCHYYPVFASQPDN